MLRRAHAAPKSAARRHIRLTPSSVVLPLVASVGSIVAWTHWRPPLEAPAEAKLAHSLGGLGPLGTGLASSHGLGTPHGAIGLASAIACFAGILGLLLPGRLRLLAAAVIALSSIAIAVNGLTAFLSANHLHNSWSSVIHTIGGTGSSSSLSGVTSAIAKSALAPSAGATGAGAVGLFGAISSLRSALRSARSVI